MPHDFLDFPIEICSGCDLVPNVVTYTALIDAYARVGNARRSEEILRLMTSTLVECGMSRINLPIGSMYGIYTVYIYIFNLHLPYKRRYTIHGWYGLLSGEAV